MPIVLTDDLQKLVLDKASEFTDALNKQFQGAGSSAPTSSDSLTNPIGSGNAPAATDTTTDAAPPALPAPDAPVTAPLVAPSQSPTAPAPRTSQFALGLSPADAYAACGPAAAMAFAQTYGRTPTASEALQLAKSVGWSQAQGMAGVGSEQALLQKMGVSTKLENGVNWDHVTQDASAGNPVIIDTPGHYFYIDGAQNGKYHVGTSGTDLRGGGEWMTPADMAARMGAPRAALYADNPMSVRPSTVAPPTQNNPSAASVNATGVGTTPSSQPSVLDQAKAFTDNLNNQFQSATSTAGQAKDNVLQQAQAFTDNLNSQFKSAAGAVGGALPDIASGLQSSDYANSPVGQQAAGNPQNPFAVKDQATSGLANTIVPPNTPIASGAAQAVLDPTNLAFGAGGIPMALGSAAGGQVASDATGALGGDANAQSVAGGVGSLVGGLGAGAAASHLPGAVDSVLQGLDRTAPPDVAYASTGRPLFGRGGVPGGARDASGASIPPTMPAPTQPQDLTTALEQSQVQATLQKIQGMGYSPDEAANLLRSNGVPEEHIQTALNPPTPEQVPTSTRPASTRTASPSVPATTPTEPAPSVTVDAHGNVVTGELPPADTTPPSPPEPPTADTLGSEPPSEQPPIQGAVANQQPKNPLQRVQSAIGDVLNPAANAPKPVQDAVQKFVTTKNLAVVQIQRQVDAGLLSQDAASQAIGQAKGKAQQQFLNDIRNSSQGVELKSVLAQHASIDSQGENVVGNPKPAGWVNGDPLGLHGVWVSPEINTVVKNVLNQGDSVPVLSGLAAAQGQLKQVVLNSPFHAFQEAFQAVRLGGGQLDAAGTKAMLGASTLNTVNPGGFKAYLAKPETQELADNFIKDGGTLRQGEAGDFFNASGVKSMAIRGGIGGGVSGGTTYLNDKAQGKSDQEAITDALTHAAIGAAATGPAGQVIGKAIFDRQIPTLKLEGYKMLVQNGYDGKAAAAMVNQTFGGNNLQTIARSNVVQTVMRSTLLAPDWWEGFARNFLTAIPGAPVSREMGGLARRQVAATAVSAAFTLEGLNLLTTGHLTDQNQAGHQLDLEIPHSMVAGIPGAPQGTPGQMDHIDVLGPIKTMASALMTMPGEGNPGDVGAFAHGRAGTFASGAMDLAQNNNPATGKPIVPPGEGALDAAGDIGGYAASRVLPIGTTGIDQGAKVAGPVGGVAEYLTGMRQSSATPDQNSLRGYYANLDKSKADMHDWLQQQPEYQTATPAAQRSMQAEKDIELEKYLREQNNVAPLDKGMPAKYIGVSDPRQQVQIDEAKARVDAYKSDPLHSPRPATNDYVLAAHMLDPRYTQAGKARSVSNKTLDQRFQQQFTAP